MSADARALKAALTASFGAAFMAALLWGAFRLGEAQPGRGAAQLTLISARLDVLSHKIDKLAPSSCDPVRSGAREAAELRRVVREELATTVGPPAASSDGGGPSSAMPDEDLESESRTAAYRDGLALVATETSIGRWTEQDAQALSQLLREMGPEQQSEVIRNLLVAINSGAVTMSIDGPPF